MPLDISMALQGSSPDKKPRKKSRTRTVQLPARTTRHSHASQVDLLQPPDPLMSMVLGTACPKQASMIKLLLSCSQAHTVFRATFPAAITHGKLLLPANLDGAHLLTSLLSEISMHVAEGLMGSCRHPQQNYGLSLRPQVQVKLTRHLTKQTMSLQAVQQGVVLARCNMQPLQPQHPR